MERFRLEQKKNGALGVRQAERTLFVPTHVLCLQELERAPVSGGGQEKRGREEREVERERGERPMKESEQLSLLRSEATTRLSPLALRFSPSSKPLDLLVLSSTLSFLSLFLAFPFSSSPRKL